MKTIPLFKTYIDNNELKQVKKVLDSGWLTKGKKSSEFEKKIKKLIKSDQVLSCNSCTNGIFATIIALGLKKGDEVITSPLTFVSTINTLYQLGLKIKLVDIDIKNYNIDTEKLIKSITKKTKLILVTHYGGYPCEMERIIKVCKQRNIKLIEDAATAFGSKIGKKYIGSFKNSVAVFSFYPNKIITTGEGGIIALNNKELAKKLKPILYCGMSKDLLDRKDKKLQYKYEVNSPGYKFNFTDLQAAIGIAQLDKFKLILHKRKKVKKNYDYYLREMFDKKILIKKEVKKKNFSSEYNYTILLNDNKLTKYKRDDLIIDLDKMGIKTTVHYIPANFHNFYKKKFSKFNLSNSNYVYKNIISLPFHSKLSKKDVVYVCTIIKKILTSKGK